MQFDRIRAMFFQRTLRACWCTCAPRSTVVPGMGSEASARAASVKFSSRQGRAAPLCLCAVSAERCPVAALSWRFDPNPVPGRRFVLRDKVHLPPAPESTLFFRSCVILMTLSSVQNNCTPSPPKPSGWGWGRTALWALVWPINSPAMSELLCPPAAEHESERRWHAAPVQWPSLRAGGGGVRRLS